MGKFEVLFQTPVPFEGNALGLSDIFSRAEAASIFGEYLERNVAADELEKDIIRFGYPPDTVDYEGDGPCWYTGANATKDSKKVWLLYF